MSELRRYVALGRGYARLGAVPAENEQQARERIDSHLTHVGETYLEWLDCRRRVCLDGEDRALRSAYRAGTLEGPDA